MPDDQLYNLAALYEFLSLAFHAPPDETLLDLAREFPQLEPFLEDELADQFTWLFAFNVYPYASVYVDPSAHLNAPSTALLTGVYQVLGLDVQLSAGLAADDHIAALFEAQRILLERQAKATNTIDQERARHAQWILLSEHILPWMPLFLDAIKRLRAGFYHTLADLAREVLAEHSRHLFSRQGLALRGEEASRTAQHSGQPGVEAQIQTGKFADSDQQLLRWLSPAQVGIYLSRHDIVSMGRRLDLPVRFAERRFMLKSLLQSAAEKDCLNDLMQVLREQVREGQNSLASWCEQFAMTSVIWLPYQERQQAFALELQTIEYEHVKASGQ